MSQESFKVNDLSYINVENFIKEGQYIVKIQEFDDYKPEMLKNNCCGFYNINAILDNGDLLKHKFVFIEKKYEELLLYPMEIPNENMFNTTETIIKKEYSYEPVNILDYQTKNSFLVDFDGSIRKKEENDETIRINKTNFRVKPENGYDIKEYMKNGETLSIDDFKIEYKEMINRYPRGLYEITIVLNTGEHINLYYRFNERNDKEIKIMPLFEDNILRNMHNTPKEYIKTIFYRFYRFSSKIHGNYFYLEDLNSYTNHMYEKHEVGEYILISTETISKNMLTALKLLGNKGKIIYKFRINKGNSITTQSEIYEFVKIKKNYQDNRKFIILKTVKLPIQSWQKTELSDILTEKWEYLID